MADNTVLNAGAGGDTIASDDIGGVKFQRIKLVHGTDGVNAGDISNINPLPINFPATGTARDAFGWLRVSSTNLRGFGGYEYGRPDVLVEQAVTGTGAVSNNLDEASISLTTGGTASGAKAIAQTRTFFRYIPGRSQLIRCTGSLATLTANVRQRVGYFCGTDGLFLEADGTDLFFVRRTSTAGGGPIDNRVARSSWYDRFDGTGPSGITLDLTTTFLMWFDLEWLGVGRYRFGFASPTTGELLVAYEAAGVNVLAVPYIRTANLPVRYEIENTGTAAAARTLKWICYSVDSEGGEDPSLSLQQSIDSGTTSTALANGTFRPIIAMRAKTTGPNSVTNRGQIRLRASTVVNTGNSSILVRLIRNPTTLTQAGGAVTWVAGTGISETAAFTNAADTVAGGSIIDSYYVASSSTVKGSGNAEVFFQVPIVYSELDGRQDTIVVAAAGLGGTAAGYGNLVWQELFT
jgi:hypothetical protein